MCVISSFVAAYPHVELYSSQVVVKEECQSQQREAAVVLLLLSSPSNGDCFGHILLADSQTHTHTCTKPPPYSDSGAPRWAH